jgi:hypothetical protein
VALLGDFRARALYIAPRVHLNKWMTISGRVEMRAENVFINGGRCFVFIPVILFRFHIAKFPAFTLEFQ